MARRVPGDFRGADPLDGRDVGTFTPRKRATRCVSKRVFLPSSRISVGKDSCETSGGANGETDRVRAGFDQESGYGSANH
jgi:hypothetical protein